jgi:hypothetical protein
VLLVVMAVFFGIPWCWSYFAGPERPLSIGGEPTAVWEPGGRSFIVESGPRTFTTACSLIWITRTLVTTINPSIPVGAEAIGGSLSDEDGSQPLPALRRISVVPSWHPRSTLRVRLPDSIDARDVLGLVVTVGVPDNRKCENGWSGDYALYQTSIGGDPGVPVSPPDRVGGKS